MKVPKEYRNLLYKDSSEPGYEVFILTRFGEIFEYSDQELGMYVLKAFAPAILKVVSPTFEDRHMDEGFILIRFKVADLPKIMALNGRNRRFKRDSKFMLEIEDILGHECIPTDTDEMGLRDSDYYIKNYNKKNV